MEQKNEVDLHVNGTRYLNPIAETEDNYYLPLYFALTLQKHGDFSTALDWFRKVYDYKDAGLVDQVKKVLPEQNGSTLYNRQEKWLADPLNPHRLAATRAGVDKRFILIALIRCLLDYAEAEFTADTAESLGRARELYLTTQRLLAEPALAQHTKNCQNLIGELFIEIGDPEWIEFVRPLLEQALEANQPEAGLTEDIPDLGAAIKDILSANSRPWVEMRADVLKTITDHLQPSPPVSLEQNLQAGRVQQVQVMSELLRDPTTFNTVQQVERWTASTPASSALTGATSIMSAISGSASVATVSDAPRCSAGSTWNLDPRAAFWFLHRH